MNIRPIIESALQLAVASALAAIPIYTNETFWTVGMGVFGTIAAVISFAAAREHGGPGLAVGLAAASAWAAYGLIAEGAPVTIAAFALAASIGFAALAGAAYGNGMNSGRPGPAVAWIATAGILAGIAVAPGVNFGTARAQADLESHMAMGRAALALSELKGADGGERDMRAFRLIRDLHQPKGLGLFADPSQVPLYATDFAIFMARKSAMDACAKTSDKAACVSGSETIGLAQTPKGPAPTKAELALRLARASHRPFPDAAYPD